IAAVTCDDVGRSRPGFYPFADFGEHRVTPPMASAVVDELKAVQIDHHHREGVVQRRLCASKRALRRPLEDLTVVETCEAVVRGVVAQPSLGFLARADVVDHADANDGLAAWR